jgi:hypothetical protein
MGTLSARALRDSLQKARNVGIIEERVTLFDDVEVVVRNLRPDEYESIDKDVKDLEGVDYLYGFQIAHVKRAIVELNGQDLRGVQFVDDEEDDPKKPGTPKAVKRELADWLLLNVLSTWSKEALYVVYRKIEDAVERAEKKARDGIEFLTADESGEDRLRRVVGELKELEDGLPTKLVDHVLDESGYMRKSSADEIKRAMETADKIKREAQAQAAPAQPTVQQAPQPVAPPPVAQQAPQPVAPPPVVQQAAAPGPDPDELMRNRQPMNQVVDDVPQPHIVSPMPRQNIVPASRQQPAPPPDVHPPLQGIPGPVPHGSAAARAAKNAALETGADLSGAIGAAPQALPPRPAVTPTLEKRLPQIDPKAAMSVMDPKPKGGINPHFRPQGGRGL